MRQQGGTKSHGLGVAREYGVHASKIARWKEMVVEDLRLLCSNKRTIKDEAHEELGIRTTLPDRAVPKAGMA